MTYHFTKISECAEIALVQQTIGEEPMTMSPLNSVAVGRFLGGLATHANKQAGYAKHPNCLACTPKRMRRLYGG